MEAITQKKDTRTAPEPLLLDKAFFGKDNCLTIQIRGKSTYFKWGKKETDTWNWKTAKFSDTELGSILRVLRGEADDVSFYHSFNDQATKIFVRKNEETLYINTDNYKKGLNSGEQKVLETLLTHAIWMMNLA